MDEPLKHPIKATKSLNLEWFNIVYPNKNERYWAVSDYLHEAFDGKIKIFEKTQNELLGFIQQYTIEKIGVDPFLDINTNKF